jgi:hypothetical protein
VKKKLERDTSTPERRRWWDSVKAAAAEAPKLQIRESVGNPRSESGEGPRTQRKQLSPPRGR